MPLLDAVVLAKAYVHQGIAAATRLGAGAGPVRRRELRAHTLRRRGCAATLVPRRVVSRRDASLRACAATTCARLPRRSAQVAHTGFPSTDASMPWLTDDAATGAARPLFARCEARAARGLLPVMDSSDGVAAVVAAGARDVQ
eukprot:5241341-Prymnesium_polylepis.1